MDTTLVEEYEHIGLVLISCRETIPEALIQEIIEEERFACVKSRRSDGGTEKNEHSQADRSQDALSPRLPL